MKNYELIEHTADMGVRVKGNDLKGLFENTALAMFDIMAEKKSKISAKGGPDYGGKNQKSKIVIKQKSDNLEELFINWLNELLSLSAIKEKIFCKFRFKSLSKKSLEAEVSGCDIKNYRVNTEIKAATYHGLKIQHSNLGWQAEVIFDV